MNAIFCNAFQIVVSSKQSVLASHCSSKKHIIGKDNSKSRIFFSIEKILPKFLKTVIINFKHNFDEKQALQAAYYAAFTSTIDTSLKEASFLLFVEIAFDGT